MRKLLLLLFLWPMALIACDCNPTTFQQKYDLANVVFVGRCMDVTTNAIKGNLNVVFQIDSSWKRAIEPVMTVHTDYDEGMCGYPFKKGEQYIVFARKAHQTLTTSLCSGNVNGADKEMLARLGPGIKSGRPEFTRKMNLLLIGLGVAGLLFMLVIVLRKRIFPGRT